MKKLNETPIGYLTTTQTIYVAEIITPNGVKYGASAIKEKASNYALSGVDQATVGKPDWFPLVGTLCPKEFIKHDTWFVTGTIGMQKQWLPDAIRYHNTTIILTNGYEFCIVLVNEFNPVQYIYGRDLVQCMLQAVIEYHKNIGKEEIIVDVNLLRKKNWLVKLCNRLPKINLNDIA